MCKRYQNLKERDLFSFCIFSMTPPHLYARYPNMRVCVWTVSGRSAGAVRRCDTQWQQKPAARGATWSVWFPCTFPLIPISVPEELPPTGLCLHSAAPSHVEVKEIIGHLWRGLMGDAEGYCCQAQHRSHLTIKQNTKEKGLLGFSRCLLKKVNPRALSLNLSEPRC